MRIRFWGTRGSLPVSLTAADIKQKIVDSLLAAAGRSFRTREDAQSFVEKELPFAVSHTYGGNSSCVELDIGSDEYILCDLGTGARPFGLEAQRVLRLDFPVPEDTFGLDRVELKRMMRKVEYFARHFGPKVEEMFFDHRAPKFEPSHKLTPQEIFA